MVSITPTPPHPRTLGPPTLSVSPTCSSASAPDRAPFQQFMLLSAHSPVPVLHRGLEMLSPPPPYTVTSKIFRKLDWDWQFGIQQWKLWLSGNSWG